MISQENLVPMQLSSKEVGEELNEQELVAVVGGVSTAIPLGTLRRSFSESDLTRLRKVPSPDGSPIPMSPGGANSPSEMRERAGLIGTRRDPLVAPHDLAVHNARRFLTGRWERAT
jgi:hypothetical protein